MEINFWPPQFLKIVIFFQVRKFPPHKILLTWWKPHFNISYLCCTYPKNGWRVESPSCAFSLVVTAFFIHKFNCLTSSSKNFFPVATLSSQWANSERSTVASPIPSSEHIPRRAMCISKTDLQLPRHLREWKEYEGSGSTIIYFVFLWHDKFQWLITFYQNT